jgi:hypothetical protein
MPAMCVLKGEWREAIEKREKRKLRERWKEVNEKGKLTLGRPHLYSSPSPSPSLSLSIV